MGFLKGSAVRNLSVMQKTLETRVWSLGGEDPPEEVMATQSSIPAWKVPWTEALGGLESTESQRVGHCWVSEPVSELYNNVQLKH